MIYLRGKRKSRPSLSQIKRENKMGHAQICPVCGGRGMIPDMKYNPASTATIIEITCHGCGGMGWVIVPEDNWPYYFPETASASIGDDDATWRCREP